MSQLPSTEPVPALNASLGAIQQWMLTAMTTAGGLLKGLDKAHQQHGWRIQDVITASPDVDPQRGLDVYASGYWLRLLACLQSDYPALRLHLGEQLFDFFCRAYLGEHPSGSYSLYDLGNEFTRFLRRTQSAAARAGNDLRFPLDLALIEHARNLSRRAKGLEGRAVTAHSSLQLLAQTFAQTFAQTLTPSYLFTDVQMQLSLPASTRLILASHPLAAFQPWLDGVEPSFIPDSGTGYIAVSRKQFRVSCHALSDWQFFTLAAARHQPRSLAYCVRAAARRCHRPEPEIQAHLALWLPVAQEACLLNLA